MKYLYAYTGKYNLQEAPLKMNQPNEITNSYNNSYIQTNWDEYVTNVFNNLDAMSLEEMWEVLDDMIEEYQEDMEIDEEELERQGQDRNRQFQEQIAERRRLFALGLYELEDGEILE